MATQNEKLQKLEAELKLMKDTLTKYGNLFKGAGFVDTEEQKQIDQMQTVIKKIEAKVKLNSPKDICSYVQGLYTGIITSSKFLKKLSVLLQTKYHYILDPKTIVLEAQKKDGSLYENVHNYFLCLDTEYGDKRPFDVLVVGLRDKYDYIGLFRCEMGFALLKEEFQPWTSEHILRKKLFPKGDIKRIVSYQKKEQKKEVLEDGYNEEKKDLKTTSSVLETIKSNGIKPEYKGISFDYQANKIKLDYYKNNLTDGGHFEGYKHKIEGLVFLYK